MKTIVFSLGGSLIIPDRINTRYLKKFSKLIQDLNKNYKIVIVTGGGVTARRYINALRSIKLEEPYTSIVGIETTKLNASLVAGYLKQFHLLPNSLTEVKKILNKEKLVICGALGFQPNMTSDGDAAQIAQYLNAEYFINLTNVNGLYTKNPKEHLTARRIPEISFKDFHEIVKKIKFKAGQHFVLDQSAAKIINKHKITTAIINGNKLKEIKRFLDNKKFLGTIIK
jgi:uridylate kinase